ncbi:hypothetical protein FB451DRAFT_1385799 [Mycena latifolia]|nr:hypothetical protein FB451DRAFT_1385799 [Mycena latifolia]
MAESQSKVNGSLMGTADGSRRTATQDLSYAPTKRGSLFSPTAAHKLVPQWTPSAPAASPPSSLISTGVNAGSFVFAEANTITLAGGSDATVGLVGGFLQGGGHGVLTPWARAPIQGRDARRRLFFALRGGAVLPLRLSFTWCPGGGGTFGVAAKDPARTKALWALIADNILAWADAGWGGYAMPELTLFVTQRLDEDAAAASMAPIIVHAEQTALHVVYDRCGWARRRWVRYSVSLTSRLVSRASFAFESSRAELITSPTAAGHADVAPERTSFTPCTVTSMGMRAWYTTAADMRGVYERTSRLIDYVTAVTPDAAHLGRGAAFFRSTYKC